MYPSGPLRRMTLPPLVGKARLRFLRCVIEKYLACWIQRVFRDDAVTRGMSPARTDSSSPRECDRFANSSYSLVKLKECDGHVMQRT